MNKQEYLVWDNLSFVTKSYGKNSDFIVRDDNIITEYDGEISLLRLSENKVPIQIGEYCYSVLNLGLSRDVNANLDNVLKSFADSDDVYLEFREIYNNNIIDFKNINRVVILESLVVQPVFRKHGITEEFIELIYRQYFDEKTLILGFFKPFQYNLIDNYHFLYDKTIEIKERSNDVPRKIPANEFYGLDDLKKNDDQETNNYKIFGVGSRCGFKRIADSHLFKLYPETIFDRLLMKRKLNKDNNLENYLNNT